MSEPQPHSVPDAREYTARIVQIWAMEETIRLFLQNNMPLSLIREHMTSRAVPHSLPPSIAEGLLTDESTDRIRQGLHTRYAAELLDEMESIHRRVSKNEHNVLYQGCYLLVLPTIVSFRAAHPKARDMGEIEILCTILYSAMLCSLSNKATGPHTEKMLQEINALFALIDQEYRRTLPDECQNE